MKAGDVIAGRYELEELVGTGGMSSVYRAQDRLLERNVALKILHDQHLTDADTVERFRREARAVAQLSHPNIVTVIDRGEADGKQFIVFEYIAGTSLKALVERGGPLPVRRALELVLQTARGLAFAHRHGLIHRDVKPQNVLVNGGGSAKVTDFGIARSMATDGMTQTGTVMGTSAYIAPEQATGGDVDERTDVYSLGVVLFELLTGSLPFGGDSFVSVAMKHVHEPPPSVLALRPEVPARVAGVVERALAKHPGDRFASMEELAGELGACLAALGDEPDRDPTMIVTGPLVRTPARRTVRSRRRWPLLLLLAGLVLLATAGAGLYAVSRDGEGGAGGNGGNGGGGGGGSTAVELAGVASYDPEPGDAKEHDEAVARATDADPASYWTTEEYKDFAATKSGVGLVLDAGSATALASMTVTSDTPGFTARIDAGDSRGGPFTTVAGEQEVSKRTTFRLDGAEARYYVVWVTAMPDPSRTDERAHVNEVTALR